MHSNTAFGIENLSNRTIKYRNFEGKGGRFNAEGKRNFCVVLDENTANQLEAEGYYVKRRVLADGDTESYIKINVGMDSKWPPEIHVFTRNGENLYGAAELAALDEADIIKGEVWFKPYQSVNSDHKTAWLDEMIVAIRDNQAKQKYASLFDDGVIPEDDGFLPNEQMPWD